jgi:hypothetical protein
MRSESRACRHRVHEPILGETVPASVELNIGAFLEPEAVIECCRQRIASNKEAAPRAIRVGPASHWRREAAQEAVVHANKPHRL